MIITELLVVVLGLIISSIISMIIVIVIVIACVTLYPSIGKWVSQKKPTGLVHFD